MGNQVPLSGITGRFAAAMPGIVAANLRCRGCADPQRGCQQRSRAYACGISPIAGDQRVGASNERADIPDPAAGVSAAPQAILGPSLLGDWLWGVEHREYHRSADSGVLGASSWPIEYGE